MKTADVAIIGGGAIGAACARAAALRGLTVAIFEPGPAPAAASPASAGMLAPQIEPADDTLVSLSVRARDLYEPLAPALRDTTGIDIGFWRSGIAAVAFDEPAAARLKEEVGRQRQAGLRCDWLEVDDVRERWPGAAPDCQGALFAPEDGDTALLLGDYLYAHGLVRVAEAGTVQDVADLAALISLCAQLRADALPGDGEAWAETASKLGPGRRDPEPERVKSALAAHRRWVG